MVEERIYFGAAGNDLIIVPIGHITAALCPELKAKIQGKLDPDSRIGSLRFDLSACDYMDSTFLGLIVYFAKAARSLGLGAPLMHRANAQCKSLFRTMGMMTMLRFSDEACPSLPEGEELVGNEAMSAGFLLDVHKELSLLSAENEERFRLFTGLLSESLRPEAKPIDEDEEFEEPSKG